MSDNEKLLRDEAQKFCNALVRTKPMLDAFGKVLTEKAATPDELIGRINAFIRSKSQNGVDDYETDYDHVLQIQQTMQAYTLLYWNGFYTTKLGKAGEKTTTDGPEFVIAATLDPDAPVHVGLDRTQIIEPKFQNLVLTWEKSAVQNNAGKLIFNLVPDTSGRSVRTFAGTWTDNNGETRLLTGVIDPQDKKTPEQKEQEKFSLPPALQVIFPAITALGAIVAMLGGIVGMLWIGKQWKEKNLDRAEKEAAARRNPDDAEARRAADDAAREADSAEQALDRGSADLQGQRARVQEIRGEEFAEAVRQVADPLLPPLDEVRDGIAAVIAEQNSSAELRAAAAQQAKQVDPGLVVRDSESSDEESSGTEIEGGALDLNLGED